MVSFDNTEIAFSDRSDKEISRARMMYRLMRSPIMVKLGKAALTAAFGLKLPIKGMIRSTVFAHFCGGESVDESLPTIDRLGRHKIMTLLDYSSEDKETDEAFDRSAGEVIKTIRLAAGNPLMPFAVFKPTGLIRMGLMAKLNAKDKLNAREQVEWENAKNRVKNICQEASENGISVFIDAEESWIQDTIDGLVEEMMASFNHQRAVVQNTLQLYRKDRLDYLEASYERAKKNGLRFGVKLVRGAYLEQERERAAQQGYPSPVYDNKNETDRDYDLAVDFCVGHHPDIDLFAGTHNEESSKHLVHLLTEKGIEKDSKHVYFSQLYGMSDNISYNLADAGYNVVKYVPYGPIEEVMPYLIRRAEENTSIAGQTGRELGLIEKEMARRKGL